MRPLYCAAIQAVFAKISSPGKGYLSRVRLLIRTTKFCVRGYVRCLMGVNVQASGPQYVPI